MSTSEGFTESTRLFRIYSTLTQMLLDRGFTVTKDEQNLDQDSFTDRFGEEPMRSSLERLHQHAEDPSRKIFVFFPDEEKVRVSDVKEYWEKMKDENVNRAILVMKSGITAMAKKGIMRLLPEYVLEQFTDTELLVNITEHVLVPKHIVLSDEGKKTLLKRYKIKETQLPRIQKNDPVARYYGLNQGQVVKIVRPSETAGRYVTYRYVCQSLS